ncbi:BclA C-terminal domain-containing protein [Halalkalibacter oceani]|uniref:BclA C-terminal domain-containing protein n=1 Tax=Halalkalibacter oceani TaxID=1653776 RepID=UPI00339B64B2
MSAIATSQTNLGSVQTSTDGSDVLESEQWVTPPQWTAYSNAITSAISVQDDVNASQTEVNNAIASLAVATQTFDDAKQNGTIEIEGSASNSSGSFIAVTLGGTSIPLPDSQELNGITSNAENTVFTVEVAGEYELSYDIYITADLLVSSRITVNGNPIPSTIDSSGTSKRAFNGSATVSVEEGDELSLQLYGLLGGVTLDLDNPTTLTIKKIN